MLSPEEISANLDSQKSEYKGYIDDFDRTADGAGSSKGKDRFSAKDIRNMFKERGDLSKADGAQMVLDYADKAGDAGSSMGGGSQRELDKLRGYLNEEDSEPVDVAEEPYQMSEPLAKARANVDAYDEHILPNQGDIIFGLDNDPTTGESVNTQNYLDAFSLNLKKNLEPVEADGAPRESKVKQEEDAVAGMDWAWLKPQLAWFLKCTVPQYIWGFLMLIPR